MPSSSSVRPALSVSRSRSFFHDLCLAGQAIKRSAPEVLGRAVQSFSVITLKLVGGAPNALGAYSKLRAGDAVLELYTKAIPYLDRQQLDTPQEDVVVQSFLNTRSVRLTAVEQANPGVVCYLIQMSDISRHAYNYHFGLLILGQPAAGASNFSVSISSFLFSELVRCSRPCHSRPSPCAIGACAVGSTASSEYPCRRTSVLCASALSMFDSQVFPPFCLLLIALAGVPPVPEEVLRSLFDDAPAPYAVGTTSTKFSGPFGFDRSLIFLA